MFLVMLFLFQVQSEQIIRMSDRYSRDREYYRRECRRKFGVTKKGASKTVSSSASGSQWEVMDIGEGVGNSAVVSPNGVWPDSGSCHETGMRS